MIQHKPILTDAEMHALIYGNPSTLGLSIARLKDFIRQVEKAVVAKLVAEQEPTWWEIKEKSTGRRETTDCGVDAEFSKKRGGYDITPLYPRPCVSPTNHKHDCVSENGESDRQLARLQPCGCVVCYCENQERCLGCGAKYCGTHEVGEMPNPVYVDHIPDINKTAADMYWINPDYPSYESVLDAFEPISSSVEIKVGDRYEVSSAKMLPMMTVEVSELEENGDVKAYKVLGSEHAPDAGKIINLSLSIDTKEVQTLLQSYLDTLDGWQLVPVEPIEEMLKKAFSEIFDIDGISKNDLIERYQAMLAAAPKYTEGK